MTVIGPAAAAWAGAASAWVVPDHIRRGADTSPHFLDLDRFSVDDTVDRDALFARWAREVLPPQGGTVLDVGCGGGRSAVPLVPPASEVIGVDVRPAMLERFVAATVAIGVARRTVHGVWPDVADETPVADVVVCVETLPGVIDIVPFLLALTARARLAVIVDLPARHPYSQWIPAWRHFWGVEKPVGPTADQLLAVLDELGIEHEHARSPWDARGDVDRDLVEVCRRRLCLPRERSVEIAAWLADHPPAFGDESVTVRWPGAAEGGV